MFIVGCGREAKLIHLILDELRKRGVDKTVIISLDKYAEEEFQEGAAEEVLRNMKLPFKKLEDFGTLDVNKVLKSEHPDLVVVTHDQEFIKRAFVYAANRLNIPTLLLQYDSLSSLVNVSDKSLKRTLYKLKHRFCNVFARYTYLLVTIKGLKWNLFRILHSVLKEIYSAFFIYDARGTFGCKAIAVSNSYDKHVLIRRKVDPSNIFVTGNPQFDNLLQLKHNSLSISMPENLDVWRRGKVILLLTSAQVEHGFWSENMRTKFVTSIINAIAPLLNDSVHLIIKIHPLEKLGEYQKILDQCACIRGKNVSVHKHLKVSDAINVSDVVISVYSTVVLEALLLRKPVIVLNLFGEPEYLPYVEMGVAIGVYYINNLRILVRELLYNHSSQEKLLKKVDFFLSQETQYTDAQATSRICDLILQLAYP
jgi:UDP-N-acetylglucosamine 2-epimerase